MENLLVTGGAGSIGANFIRYLFEEGLFSGRIINVDKITYAGNLKSLEGLQEAFPRRYLFEKADICDHQKIVEIFEKYSINSVVHFAAESHVDRSILRPDQFIQTNIVGTFNLLEIAKRRIARIRRFHHVSTDEVFGSLQGAGLFSESSPYQPNSPYSASKAGSDHLARAYFKTYGLPVTISNSSNNYGPYHHPDKFIPLMILRALEGKKLPVYGDGLHVRDWLYVRDHCRAIWMIVQRGKPGDSYNVGGGGERTNLDVARMICDYLDQIRPLSKTKCRRDLITFVNDRQGHDRRYGVDFSKIRLELGFEPEETFDTGLKKTIHWYLEHPLWVSSAMNDDFDKWCEENYRR